jgi:hypothetical protein
VTFVIDNIARVELVVTGKRESSAKEVNIVKTLH